MNRVSAITIVAKLRCFSAWRPAVAGRVARFAVVLELERGVAYAVLRHAVVDFMLYLFHFGYVVSCTGKQTACTNTTELRKTQTVYLVEYPVVHVHGVSCRQIACYPVGKQCEYHRHKCQGYHYCALLPHYRHGLRTYSKFYDVAHQIGKKQRANRLHSKQQCKQVYLMQRSDFSHHFKWF